MDRRDGPCDLFPTVMKTFEKGSSSKRKHVWSEPEANNFNVRGAKYLSNRKKIKAPCAQYTLLGIDLLLTDNTKNPLQDTTSRSALSFARARRRGFKGFVFMINFIASYGNFIIYWTPSRNITDSSSPSPDDELLPYLTGHKRFDSLMKRFVEEDDDFRNARLKVIPIVVEGNYFLRNFVGKPAIMCNKIETQWTRDLSPEGSYLSADIHLSSSSMAITILGLVRHYVESVTLDMAFTIEGQDEAELPEELLCAMRFHHVDMVNADTLEGVERAFDEASQDESKSGDSSSNAGVNQNGHSTSTSKPLPPKTSPASAPYDVTSGSSIHSTPNPRPRTNSSESRSTSAPHSKSDDEIDKSLEADLEAGRK